MIYEDITAFKDRYPQIRLQLDVTIEIRNLSLGEADIALRGMPHGVSPAGGGYARKLGTAFSAIYGIPTEWLGWYEDSRDREWITKTEYPDLPVSLAMNSPDLQRRTVLEGRGLGLLPCFMMPNNAPRLTDPKPSTDIWIMCHQNLSRHPRVQLLMSFFMERFKTYRPRLAGERH